MPNILLIDDEHEIRATLSAALGRRGYKVETAIDIKAAQAKDLGRYDLIMLDVMLPDGSGVDLLQSIMQNPEAPPVVMMSGVAGVETAVQSIRLGAVDFLEKPLTLDRVLVTIENTLKADKLREENLALSRLVYGSFIGDSSRIKKIKKEIETTAPRSTRFLILGENGTGKELVARMIHEQSRYAAGRFVPVNCAALPSELIESELFGHIKGSFTGAVGDKTGRFAEADRGTIFLDEIADMQAEAQAKILRVLESGELRPVGSSETEHVDLNVVAATNRNILKLVDDGDFRQDLFYRLNVVTFNLPPLRERREDIPILYHYFLDFFARQSGRPPVAIDDAAMGLLSHYQYPGNVRELKNIAERISIYVNRPKASKSDIQSLLPHHQSGPILPLKEAVDKFETDYITRAIDDCEGNMAEAARRLGLERSHLYKKLKKLNGE
jgi:two-component system nitrogen regulation response regulator NtrX